MNKKWATIVIVAVILVFLGFIVFDVAFNDSEIEKVALGEEKPTDQDNWTAIRVFEPGIGKLKAVAVMQNGYITTGGDSFAACFDSDFKLKWETKTESPVTALSVSGDTVFASTQENILVINSKGEVINEWGPFEDKAIITSVACNRSFVAFADAGNKRVFVLDKKGEVKFMAGQSGEPFIIPSPYFDVALGSDNTLYVANTGHRRIEMRSLNGTMLGYFGEPGTAPGAFCGCCNPAHFALVPGGFVTAEKGINRIKRLNEKGEFTEFVSSVNDFLAPLPLDIATADGVTIYGANPADSKVYVFKRK